MGENVKQRTVENEMFPCSVPKEEEQKKVETPNYIARLKDDEEQTKGRSDWQRPSFYMTRSRKRLFSGFPALCLFRSWWSHDLGQEPPHSPSGSYLKAPAC